MQTKRTAIIVISRGQRRLTKAVHHDTPIHMKKHHNPVISPDCDFSLMGKILFQGSFLYKFYIHTKYKHQPNKTQVHLLICGFKEESLVWGQELGT